METSGEAEDEWMDGWISYCELIGCENWIEDKLMGRKWREWSRLWVEEGRKAINR